METETLGLLSGIGHLPVDVAKSAKERGCRIVAIGVVPDIDRNCRRLPMFTTIFISEKLARLFLL